MRIEIHGQGFKVTEETRNYVERRLAFALDRFTDFLSHVKVRLADLNGPKGGVDQECQICMGLIKSKELVVEARDSKMHAAIDSAADKAGRIVERELDRRDSPKKERRKDLVNEPEEGLVVD